MFTITAAAAALTTYLATQLKENKAVADFLNDFATDEIEWVQAILLKTDGTEKKTWTDLQNNPDNRIAQQIIQSLIENKAEDTPDYEAILQRIATKIQSIAANNFMLNAQVGDMLHQNENQGLIVNRDQYNTTNYFSSPTDETEKNFVFSELDDFKAYITTIDTDKQAATSQPIIGKKVDSLDPKAVRSFLALPLVKDHFKKHKIKKNTPLEQKLRVLHLMQNGYVLKGTFFCLTQSYNLTGFGADISSCSFGVYDSLNKVKVRKNEQIYGNLVEQYDALYELLIKELSPVEIIQWLPRIEDYAIPEAVFREILANAFIHRDYTDNNHFRITVEVFPDRLVIENTGHFPSDINPNQLDTIKSKHLNPEISLIFYLRKIIERRGSGIQRVQELLQERELPPAEFKYENNIVTVTLYKKRTIAALLQEADMAKASGKYDDALDTYQQIINRYEKIGNTASSDTATLYNNIGSLYYQKGNLDSALNYYQKALNIWKKIVPQDAPILIELQEKINRLT